MAVEYLDGLGTWSVSLGSIPTSVTKFGGIAKIANSNSIGQLFEV